MHKLFPEHWMLNAGLDENDGMVTYRQQIETQALDEVARLCKEHIASSKLFSYHSFNTQEV